MTDNAKLARAKEALHLKSVGAKMGQDKISRSDVLQREYLSGQAAAYNDAIMIIEQEFRTY